jgi:hypothetical protein
MKQIIKTVKGYESYERNGDACVFFKSKEAAESHTLFEIETVSEVEITLTEKGIEEFEAGIPIWN